MIYYVLARHSGATVYPTENRTTTTGKAQQAFSHRAQSCLKPRSPPAPKIPTPELRSGSCNDTWIIPHFQTLGMKLQCNNGTSLAGGMGTEWKPEIPAWSWNGHAHRLRALLLIVLGYTTKAVNLQDLANLSHFSTFTQYGIFSSYQTATTSAAVIIDNTVFTHPILMMIRKLFFVIMLQFI